MTNDFPEALVSETRKSLVILPPTAVAAGAIEFAEGFTNSPAAFLMLAMRAGEPAARFSFVYPVAPCGPRSLANRAWERWKPLPTGHFGESLAPAAARKCRVTL